MRVYSTKKYSAFYLDDDAIARDFLKSGGLEKIGLQTKKPAILSATSENNTLLISPASEKPVALSIDMQKAGKDVRFLSSNNHNTHLIYQGQIVIVEFQ